MKAFRGTLVVAVLLAVAWFGADFFAPDVAPTFVDSMEPALFRFEKQEVIRVEVKRPDDTLVLTETDAGWVLEESGFLASRSMVNRVKHQLHDLNARATVIEATEDMALYGLGVQAVHVRVELREGDPIEFLAGDPNPSSVSYYIKPIPGDRIYTVKKSAVDYYSFTLDEFRERRFASFDSKDVEGIEADLPGGERLRLQRLGEHLWELVEPFPMAASRDKARSLMGRVSGLKAREFARDLPEGDDSDLALYGLASPRALITLSFGNRDPLVLRIGRPVSDAEDEELAYMIVEGDRTVYTARQALLEEYGGDPETLRLRRFMRMEGSDVVALKVWLAEGAEGDPAGEVHLRKGVSKWEWADGRPVPGSTPERVATRVAAVRAEEFVADSPGNLGPYGLDAPIARAIVATSDGTQRTLLIGGEGEPWVDPEERPIERYYAMVEEEPAVYLVDRGALAVLQDAVREHSRKVGRDEDKEERRDAMEMARSQEEGE
jgi:hypothetical protein